MRFWVSPVFRDALWCCAFLQEALALLPVGWRARTVRADSGFFDHALLGFLEERGLPHLIVARLTGQLKARLHSSALVWRKIDAHFAVSSFTATLHGWKDTRRFIVVRETEREDKAALGRRLLDVPGYTFRVWVTNRNEDPMLLWCDYNQRATVEQRIEELKNDLHAGGFCTMKFFATEAAFLSAILAFNLLSLYHAQVTAKEGWSSPRRCTPPSSCAERCWGEPDANSPSGSRKTAADLKSTKPSSITPWMRKMQSRRFCQAPEPQSRILIRFYQAATLFSPSITAFGMKRIHVCKFL